MRKNSFIAVVIVCVLLAISVTTDLLFNDGLVLAGTARSVKATVSNSTGGNIVFITKTGKKYHSPFCRYLKDSAIDISIEDAESQGYEPCSRCTP